MNSPYRFAYERIESRIEALIESGTLRPGDRVPSVRKLCRTENVSPATVIQALANLESKARILAKPRSGFYVRTLAPLPLPTPPDAILRPASPRISNDVADVFRNLHHPGAVPLGAGVPHPSLLPNGEVARSVSRVARQFSRDFGRYAPSDTDLSLRKEIALRLAHAGCVVSPDEIVITNGCMDALNLAVRAVASPGDTVLVESPTYFSLMVMIESLGMKALTIPATCDEGIDIGAFEKAINRHKVAACLLIPSFGNPHGARVSDERREAIVRMAARKGIPIIEDDIYGELAFDHSRPRPLKAFGDPSRNLLCSSFSKTLSPSLRVGWVVAGRYTENVQRLKWISSITTPHVTSLAVADYLRSGGYERHLRTLRNVLETNLCRISHSVADSFPQGTAQSRPGGGYFLWIELPWRVDALALRDAAVKNGISICPGPIFSASGEFRHFIRLNVALHWESRVEEAIRTLGRLAGDLNTA